MLMDLLVIPLFLMFVAYLVFSWFLFFFPEVLHRRHKYPKTPLFEQVLSGEKVLNIAHRGGPRLKTENTIEAFEQASKHSDMLQMDVCETKDGVLVVHHDHQLERTCGTKSYIRDIEYKDLPKFKEQIQLNFAPEGKTVRSHGEKIPTLEQVFEKFQTIPMNIQLKTPSQKAIKSMISLINSFDRKHNTIIGIRGADQDLLRQMDRKVMTFMNDKEFFTYFVGMFFGLTPFLSITSQSMQIPIWTEESYRWKVREWGDNWKVHLLFKVIKLTNPLMGLLAYHLRKRGIMTYFWVANCEDDFKRAFKYGASGIMTDDPPLLKEFLEGQREKILEKLKNKPESIQKLLQEAREKQQKSKNE